MQIRAPHYPTLFISLLLMFLAASLSGQSEQQMANFLKRNPEADLNGDGILSSEEANSFRRGSRSGAQKQPDPTEGDNLSSRSRIEGIDIPESISPIVAVPLKSKDGIDLSFAYRKPAGNGPFPLVIFLHGGGGYSNLDGLKRNLKTGPIQTRFLKAGYAIAASTRRPYWKTDDNPDKVGYFDSVKDTTLVIKKVKKLPGVDPAKVILYGGSGGGILAIGAASQNEIACVVAGEPATVLLLSQMTDTRDRPDYNPLMEDPLKFYNGKVKEKARALFKNTHCPVLLLQGDTNNTLDNINNQLLIPEMKSLGKDISSIRFPGLKHGFYWGSENTGATTETMDQIMKDVPAFIGKYMALPGTK